MVSNPGSVSLSTTDFKCSLISKINMLINSDVDQDVTVSLPTGVKGRIDGVNEVHEQSISFTYEVESATSSSYEVDFAPYMPVAEIYNETLSNFPENSYHIARNSSKWYAYNATVDKVLYFNSGLSSSPDGNIGNTWRNYGLYTLACDDTYIYAGLGDIIRVLNVSDESLVHDKTLSQDIRCATVDGDGRPVIMLDDGTVKTYADYNFSSVIDSIDLSAYSSTLGPQTDDMAWKDGILYYSTRDGFLYGYELNYDGTFNVVLELDVATGISRTADYFGRGIEFNSDGRIVMIYNPLGTGDYTTIVLKKRSDL